MEFFDSLDGDSVVVPDSDSTPPTARISYTHPTLGQRTIESTSPQGNNDSVPVTPGFSTAIFLVGEDLQGVKSVTILSSSRVLCCKDGICSLTQPISTPRVVSSNANGPGDVAQTRITVTDGIQVPTGCDDFNLTEWSQGFSLEVENFSGTVSRIGVGFVYN